MLIQEIKKFLEELQAFNKKYLVQGDDSQLTKITHHFLLRQNNEVLSTDDLNFLGECFKRRWLTLNHKYWATDCVAVNQIWTDLAKTLAPLVDKTYVQIMFPTVVNTHDLNNGAQLAKTEDPNDFYLSQKHDLLYSKAALIEHLIAQKYQLFTYRGLKKTQCSPLSVDELTQLKNTKYNHACFSIANEKFDNVWHFLSKKVLTKLNPNNELPVELLTQLLQLIEQYYAAKQNKEQFSGFKIKMEQFFAMLLTIEAEVVNLFYGYCIEVDKRKYYLLDYLILMNRTNEFTLDLSLANLVQCISSLIPAFSLMRQELLPCYTKANPLQERLNIVPVESAIDLLKQCKQMLLSLLTTDLYHDKRISLWDHSHKVFADAEKIYTLFRPLIEKDDADELTALYKAVYERDIKSYRQSSSQDFLSWLTKVPLIDSWYQHVRDSTLDRLGVYWFEPELIMHALLRFKTNRESLVAAIENFLDTIISTYAQSNSHFSTLQKQFRVNILFVDFLKKLEEQDRHYLLTVLRIYPVTQAQELFLANCAHHIVNRLYELRENKPVVSLRFFPTELQQAKITLAKSKSTKISELIDEYKESKQINQNDKLVSYLHQLTRPILTVEELDKINSSAEAPDYIGAPR